MATPLQEGNKADQCMYVATTIARDTSANSFFDTLTDARLDETSTYDSDRAYLLGTGLDFLLFYQKGPDFHCIKSRMDVIRCLNLIPEFV